MIIGTRSYENMTMHLVTGRLNNKDEKRDPLGDSALWAAAPQLTENTIDMPWIEWQGSVLTN